ncbi:hypothetical protein AQUCO_00400735v1 [Aquilegia coerulea]|uniref:RNase H type-1 domain-containing protein n=1 Tax=Aquilegia coerulea TaxID=218851 RepID=A0A2G5EWD6_AQUCA|nr:hypothetical protein AQUCO_00400735v1 [Aquilegia coerulea]
MDIDCRLVQKRLEAAKKQPSMVWAPKKKNNQKIETTSSHEQMEKVVVVSSEVKKRKTISSSHHHRTIKKEAQPAARWHGVSRGKYNVPQHSLLTRQVCAGALINEDLLVDEKVIHSSQCILCKQSRENTEHLFFDCEYTKNVWSEMMKWFGIQRSILKGKEEWRWIFNKCNKHVQSTEIFKAMLSATLYWLWEERNNRRFGNDYNYKTEEQLTSELKEDVLLNLQSKVKKLKDLRENRTIVAKIGLKVEFETVQPISCSWIPPKQGFVKLNTDGSLKKTRAGYGGLLRSNEGRVIECFTAQCKCKSVLELELLAIQKGIELSIKEGYAQLEVASDSLKAIQIIKKKARCPAHCRNTVQEIWDAQNHFEEVTFTHAYRETNRAADLLASLEGPCECRYFMPPLEAKLNRIIEEDLAVVYQRVKH